MKMEQSKSHSAAKWCQFSASCSLLPLLSFDGSFSSLLRSLSAEVCRRASAARAFSLIPDHLEGRGRGGSVGLRREPARGRADAGLQPVRLGSGGGANIWVEVRRWSFYRGSNEPIRWYRCLRLRLRPITRSPRAAISNRAILSCATLRDGMSPAVLPSFRLSRNSFHS